MRILLLILFAGLAGCQFDRHTAVYTTTEPKPQDLVGTYVLDYASNKLITEEGHYAKAETSIVLATDGSITIENIPDWWLTDVGDSKEKFDSGHGKWSIDKHQDWWVLSVEFHSTEQFAWQRQAWSNGFFTEMFLIGEKPPYNIYLGIGDPDENRGMEFERVR